MADRYPLVQVAGTPSELPAGDSAVVCNIAPSSQVTDFAGTDLAEVEANTRAMRVTLRPDDALAAGAGFIICRHQLGVGNQQTNLQNFTTTAITGADILCFEQGIQGFSVIKKVTASLYSGALSGVRNGPCKLDMFLFTFISSFGVASFTSHMPANTKTGTDTTGRGNMGLNIRQVPSQVNILSQPLSAGPGGGETYNLDTNPIASLEGALPNVAGATAIYETPLFDYRLHDHPLIILPNNGFVVRASAPAAVTSQTLGFGWTVRWDEWIPMPSETMR